MAPPPLESPPLPRRRPRLRHALACVAWAALAATAAAGTLRTITGPDGRTFTLRTWQTEDGLPQNSITAITSTANGRLWVSTYGGLARFDGVRFETFDATNTPGLADARIISLFASADGALWLGHDTGHVTRYAAGVFKQMPSPSPHRTHRVTGIGADASGTIWLLRHNGFLETLDGTRSIAFPGLATVPSRLSLITGGDAQLYVECDGRIAHLENDTLRPTDLGIAHRSGFVLGAGAGRREGFWIARDGRLHRWAANTLRESRGFVPWASDNAISSLLELRTGAVAAGTFDRGLYLIDLDRSTFHLDHALGLPQNWVRCLHEDREGTLWLGTGSSGLVQLVPARVAIINPPDQWQGRSVLSVFAASDDSLWAGTEGAGLYQLLDGRWRQFGSAGPTGLRFVWSIAETPDGTLWAGTWGEGLFRSSATGFQPVPAFALADGPLFALQYMPEDHALWLGCARGLLRWPDSARDQPPQTLGHLPNVCTFARDRAGTVWYGSLDSGLGRLADGVHQLFRKADGLPSDAIQSLYPDADGTLWVGTADGGLSRYRDGRFHTIGVAQGLANNSICHIADDGRGFLWLSTHHGILRVAKEELHRCADGLVPRVRCLTLDRNDGLPTIELAGGLHAASACSADGRFWYPSGKGVVEVAPHRLRLNTTPPPVVLERLGVDGRWLDFASGPPANLALPPQHQRLEFTYTTFSYTAPEKVRFRYQLEGMDDRWIEAGPGRSATYSHLPAGAYTFRVIACNNDGVWNTSAAAFAFTVRPYFWHTWWFRLLLVVAGLALAAFLSRRLVQRRLRLRIEQLHRRNAVERERSRIAQDIHDDVGASLTRIMMLAQSASPGPAAAPAPPDHLHRIYEAAHSITTALDEIVWAINPRHDSLDSLVSYMVGEFARSLLADAGLRCRLDLPVALPVWPLTAEIRHNLFLAFKEALNNAIRHAAATEVRIALRLADEAFELSVADDGRGFGPQASAPASTSDGLGNMRARMAKIGGRCAIVSAPGEGTRVTFTVFRAPPAP